MQFIDQEINALLIKGVITECDHECEEFISPIFVTEKSDGGFRLILNLKKLNESIEKIKFKMQTLTSILCLIRPNMFMAKLDIKDAYYSIPIHKDHQRLLKFKHRDRIYKFHALPNGYTAGPRKYTKVMKPPLALLRKQYNILIADYIDDLITMAMNKDKCLDNIDKVIQLLDDLGFVIHPEKSIFEPTQVMEFLGFVIDTIRMIIYLTDRKKLGIVDLCRKNLNAERITIRKLAKIIGKFNSCFIAIPQGKLHYRKLERFKTKSLRENRGKFDTLISLPKEEKEEINWWMDNIEQSSAPIARKNSDLYITTDASTKGWGADRDGTSTGGHFTIKEMESHINVLELKAALLGLKSLCHDIHDKHILLKIDNTSAVASINKMGSTKSIEMDKIVHEIWDWALSKNNWISSTHIPGKLNVEADRESRETETRTEWMLNREIFLSTITALNFKPDIDLFATRLNNQLDQYISYKPDPNCVAVDAFTTSWKTLKFYAFPPFICLPRVIQKICNDQAIGILVVPDWPNQPWYSQFMNIVIEKIYVSPRMDLLQLPQKQAKHPLHKTLGLQVAIVSGKQ